jgi:hypothetical protein
VDALPEPKQRIKRAKGSAGPAPPSWISSSPLHPLIGPPLPSAEPDPAYSHVTS